MLLWVVAAVTMVVACTGVGAPALRTWVLTNESFTSYTDQSSNELR